MKIIEIGLYSMHEYYKNSGEALKDIENYEKTLPEKRESNNIPKIAKKQETQKIEIEVEKEEEKNSLPFSEITEVVEDSPSFLAGFFSFPRIK